MIPHNHDVNPLLELDHSNKYKVIEVYDERDNHIDRIACMGQEMPFPRLNSLRLGGKWKNPKTGHMYERLR